MFSLSFFAQQTNENTYIINKCFQKYYLNEDKILNNSININLSNGIRLKSVFNINQIGDFHFMKSKSIIQNLV